jgi:hypothetical protein
MGVARFLAACGLLLGALAQAEAPAAFRRQVGEAEVDWSAGTITVSAGAAADPRMPNPNAARPGAERRARRAAEAKLRVALRTLAGEGTLDSALAQASVARVEHQSNGGVVLWLGLRFADVSPAKPAAVSLRVASMPFAWAPVVSAGGRTAPVGTATYRPAAESPPDAVRVERDGAGRLLLPATAARLLDSLAGAAVVIYLEKPQP